MEKKNKMKIQDTEFPNIKVQKNFTLLLFLIFQISCLFSLSDYWVNLIDYWTDGDRWTTNHLRPSFYLWKSNQPNDPGHVQSCVSHFVSQNSWEDKQCSNQYGVMCEFWPERFQGK